MNRRLMALLLLGATSLIACNARAEAPSTEHTFRLEDGEQRPRATLEDVEWLAGSWTGSAFGERFEEVWNPPSAGSMVGLFKLYDGDEVSFYEILLIIE